MSEDHSPTASDIETACGGRWTVWQSDTGHWWAARARPLAGSQLAAGAVPFLRAATSGELSQAISQEERLTTPSEGPGSQ